ncbi:hypothetical protein HMPREF0290_1817 [Corynebacterium efficiens YS-314]|nr:hypothetical protein HMPREF0290_1817 [Corynebacterium efficiens YS-314]
MHQRHTWPPEHQCQGAQLSRGPRVDQPARGVPGVGAPAGRR